MAESPKRKPSVTLRQRRLAAQNTKWDVFWDDITGADGSEVDGYLVIAPRGRSDKGIAGTAILPVLPSGQIGLLRNYRHAVGFDAWEAPRGFLDIGETDIVAAALRELEEETGYVTRRDRVVDLGTLAQEPSTIAATSALFAALDCRDGGSQPDLSEPGLGKLTLFSLEEALALAQGGEIQDSATLIALYRYARYRGR